VTSVPDPDSGPVVSVGSFERRVAALTEPRASRPTFEVLWDAQPPDGWREIRKPLQPDSS